MENEQGLTKTSGIARAVMGSALSDMTKERAMEYLKVMFPMCDDEKELELAAMCCRDHGLDPLLGEMIIIEYQKWNKAHTEIVGRTFSRQIPIPGTRKMVMARGDYSYLEDSPRAATAKEQEIHYGGVREDQIVFLCKLQNVHTGAVVTGWGIYPKNKIPKGTENGNDAYNMSSIRSERNALKKLPTGYLPPEAWQMVATAEGSSVVLDDGRTVDPDGVIEGEAKEIPSEPEPKKIGASDICPIHNVSNGPLKSKKNPKWHAVGHFIPKEEGGGICYKKDQENAPKQPKTGDDNTAAPKDTGSVEEPPPAPPAKETDETDAPPEGPDLLKQIDNLADAIWGKDFTKSLNKWLQDNSFGNDRRSIKESQRQEIVNKLNSFLDLKNAGSK